MNKIAEKGLGLKNFKYTANNEIQFDFRIVLTLQKKKPHKAII